MTTKAKQNYKLTSNKATSITFINSVGGTMLPLNCLCTAPMLLAVLSQILLGQVCQSLAMTEFPQPFSTVAMELAAESFGFYFLV